MLDKTLGYVLCCQSPALFLAALVLIVHYFAARRKHRFKAAFSFYTHRQLHIPAIYPADY